MSITYPNEPEAYRVARNKLLVAELDLRTKVQEVAALRQALPQGGAVTKAYEFTALDGTTRDLVDLFQHGKPSLAVYSLMFDAGAHAPCPMCTSMLDGLNGQARHITQRVGLAVVASNGIDALARLKSTRSWDALDLYSAKDTAYQRDYHGETAKGGQVPMMNVFQLSGDTVHHFWGSEGFYADVEGHPRHMDQIWPLWNVLDLTPEGRGTDWYPTLE